MTAALKIIQDNPDIGYSIGLKHSNTANIKITQRGL